MQSGEDHSSPRRPQLPGDSVAVKVSCAGECLGVVRWAIDFFGKFAMTAAQRSLGQFGDTPVPDLAYIGNGRRSKEIINLKLAFSILMGTTRLFPYSSIKSTRQSAGHGPWLTKYLLVTLHKIK